MFKQPLSIIFSVSLFAISSVAVATPVNVNTATADEISSSLKGIGPAKAQAISNYCQKMKCVKPEDLLEVKGIGEKTLSKISEDLRF